MNPFVVYFILALGLVGINVRLLTIDTNPITGTSLIPVFFPLALMISMIPFVVGLRELLHAQNTNETVTRQKAVKSLKSGAFLLAFACFKIAAGPNAFDAP